MSDKKQHFFCLAFKGKIGKANVESTVVFGFDSREPKFTKSFIKRSYLDSGLDRGVLIGISYLGYMTREEYES